MLNEGQTRFIRFIATPRSGHHAMMNWILAGCKGPVWFRNDIRSGRRKHFFARGDISVLPDIPLRRKIRGSGTLAAAYERISLADLAQMDPVKNGWLPGSADDLDVLMLRDPFNQFSSAVRQWRRLRKPSDHPWRKRMVSRWIDLAEEAVRPSELLGSRPRYVLQFDRWLSAPDLVAGELGIESTPEALTAVPAQGYGSSFGIPSAHGGPMSRWKVERQHDDESAWREMLTPRVLELGDILWPELTREVVATL